MSIILTFLFSRLASTQSVDTSRAVDVYPLVSKDSSDASTAPDEQALSKEINRIIGKTNLIIVVTSFFL